MSQRLSRQPPELRRPIDSLLSKSERALQKLKPGTWQHRRLSDNIESLRLAKAFMEGQGGFEEISQEVLGERLMALGAMIGQSEAALAKFAEGSSQASLLVNRIAALQAAMGLLEGLLGRDC